MSNSFSPSRESASLGFSKNSTSKPAFVNVGFSRFPTIGSSSRIMTCSFSAADPSFCPPSPEPFSDLTTMIFSRASLVFLTMSRPVALNPISGSPASAKEILTIQSEIVVFFSSPSSLFLFLSFSSSPMALLLSLECFLG